MIEEMKDAIFQSKFPSLRELFMTASKKSLWGNPKSKCLWFPAMPQHQQQPLEDVEDMEVVQDAEGAATGEVGGAQDNAPAHQEGEETKLLLLICTLLRI